MNTNLSKISFLNIFLILIIFSLILSTFIFKFSDALYEERVKEIEKNYIEKNKALTKEEVLRAIKKIEALRNVVYKKNKSILKDKISFVRALFDSDLEIKTTSGLIEKYEKQLDSFSWDNGTGYFYIFNLEGKILYHGRDKTLVNKDIFENIENNKELYDFLKETIVLDENYGSYKWHNPNDKTKEMSTKYVYILKDEKYGIYIAAGIYESEIEKQIKEIVFNEFRGDRYGENKYGYFWIVGMDKVMRMHPIYPQIENKINKLITLDGRVLIDVILKTVKEGGGYVYYTWNRPDTKTYDEKISYVKKIPGWDLIIGTGFYISELDDMIIEEKKKLKILTNEYLIKIFIVLSLLIILSLVVARYLSKRIEKVEIDREEQMNLLNQYKLLLDESSVVSKTNKENIITYVNKSFEKNSKYDKSELIGKPFNIVYHSDTSKGQLNRLWNTISKGKIWKGIIKNRKKSGESLYNSTTIIPIKNSQGEIIEFISSGTDVTELIENRAKLKNLFKTDTLTGLGNRVSLIDEISKNPQGALALININRFKEVNESFSHEFGDMIIKELSDRLFNYFSDKKFIVFRVQADEFAVFTKEYSSHQVNKFLDNFMNTTGDEYYKINENKIRLTYSCGISSKGDNLLAYADIALSEAKNKKVKVKIYDDSMANIEKIKNDIKWVDRIHQAIKEDRILPHFQPIYNYKTKKIDKYEALIRLVEDGKIYYPNEYLDIAKKTRLYPELTYKMVEKVLALFAKNDYEFSLNLSIEDLMNEDLMLFIYDYAKQKRVFNRMVLEVVESEEIEDNDFISKQISRLKKMGVKIAIDDFGTGYSNYDYLISLQADYIKIDGSITKHVVDDLRTQDVVKSIVSFAKKSNMKVIAEFVSSKEISDILEGLGVDFAQGYYYGKPEENLK